MKKKEKDELLRWKNDWKTAISFLLILMFIAVIASAYRYVQDITNRIDIVEQRIKNIENYVGR